MLHNWFSRDSQGAAAWYLDRDAQRGAGAEADAERAELARLKQLENDMMLEALGLKDKSSARPSARLSKTEMADVLRKGADDEGAQRDDIVAGLGFDSADAGAFGGGDAAPTRLAGRGVPSASASAPRRAAAERGDARDDDERSGRRHRSRRHRHERSKRHRSSGSSSARKSKGKRKSSSSSRKRRRRERSASSASASGSESRAERHRTADTAADETGKRRRRHDSESEASEQQQARRHDSDSE